MRVVILGAGITGLSLAYFLKKFRGAECTILEASSLVGGWIQTDTSTGFLFEKGPRGFRPKGKGLYTLYLSQCLGLDSELISASKAARQRYIYTRGRLQGISNLLLSSCLSIIKEPFLKSKVIEDESVETFFTRRFGADMTRTIIDSLVLGIYAGDMAKLSIRTAFPRCYLWEQESGSVIRGLLKQKSLSPSFTLSAKIQNLCKAPIVSYRRGMRTLIDALKQELQGCIHTQAPAIALHGKGVETEDAVYHADHIYSTLPAHALVSLLKFPFIPYQSLYLVHIGYSKEILKKSAFGVLFPRQEKAAIFGVVWDSCSFPEQNTHAQETRLTVMLPYYGQSETEALDTALQSLQRYLNIHEEPKISKVTLAKDAIPQFPVGYFKTLETIQQKCKQQFPNLTLAGTFVHGVAVNDCVYSAYQFAQKA